MGKEIERKFLVTSDSWRQHATGKTYRQGYLSRRPGCTVRIRLAGDEGFLTIKGKLKGLVRDEFEYPVPAADAEEMLTLCEGSLIEKTRYRLPQDDLVWEIDEFHGDNDGLVVAEMELPTPDHPFHRPEWIGEEVTDDRRYYNAELSVRPFREWG